MRTTFRILLPTLIGLCVAFLLFFLTRWWLFWIIFPWIGFSISTGLLFRHLLKGRKRLIGRKIAIFMVMPCLLIFLPLVNNENFQLEGIVLLLLVGFFGKGVIHYAIAKIFGPLIWGRGFCGWACWTAAVLDWLPIKNCQSVTNPQISKLRYLTLAISAAIPVYLVFVLNYNVRVDYINDVEALWMFAGNAVYYLLAIPLAFIKRDKRFFCKNVCPVSLVMMPTASLSLIKVKPKSGECIECDACNRACPMGIDVMSFAKEKKPIRHSECILCTDCSVVCPVGAI